MITVIFRLYWEVAVKSIWWNYHNHSSSCYWLKSWVFKMLLIFGIWFIYSLLWNFLLALDLGWWATQFSLPTSRSITYCNLCILRFLWCSLVLLETWYPFMSFHSYTSSMFLLTGFSTFFFLNKELNVLVVT